MYTTTIDYTRRRTWQDGSVHPAHLKVSPGLGAAVRLMLLKRPGGNVNSSGLTNKLEAFPFCEAPLPLAFCLGFPFVTGGDSAGWLAMLRVVTLFLPRYILSLRRNVLETCLQLANDSFRELLVAEQTSILSPHGDLANRWDTGTMARPELQFQGESL